MTDLKDKIILVTGSTDGIGKQTALELLGMGAHVIIHGRDPVRTSEVFEYMNNKKGSGNLSAVTGDLSSLEEIRSMSDDIHKRIDRLDVLINNAGVYRNQRMLSHDGHEITFAVNHLAYFLLTGLVVDLLLAAPRARIVNVASQAHANRLDFDNLQGEKYYEGYDAYSRSKLCNILFTCKLAEMLSAKGVTANALHPGVIRTKLLHEGWGSGGSSPDQGAKTSVYLAGSSQVEGVSGKYFSNLRMVRPAAISEDQSVQDRLWKESERMAGFHYE